MSWYFTYALTYKNKEDGKLYPLGPFDYKGDYKNVLSKSRSFASALHERFTPIDSAEDRKSLISEELFKVKTGWEGEEEKEYAEEFFNGEGYWMWSYLPIEDLPEGDYIKRGYVLIDQIEEYEKDEGYFEGFYPVLTPQIYAKKLENELKFGRPKPKKDCEGNEIEEHSVSEFSYYAWVDRESEEYEAYKIREALYLLRTWYNIENGDEELYVLLTQG